MSTSVRVPSLPDCDICKHPAFGSEDKKQARFDAKTDQGPWAYLCPEHYKSWRAYPLLGTGRGQLLLLEGEDEAKVMGDLAPQVV